MPTLQETARCLALDVTAAATHGVLREAGIANVLLKGPGVARLLYADQPGLRPYTDVDLLVAPSAFERAQQVLAGRGYRSAVEGFRDDDFVWHERPWRAPGPGELTIDLHRGFAGVGDAATFWGIVSSSAQRLDLAGTPVPVPGEACAVLLIALHAAAPARASKPLTDLLRALEVLPEDAWQAAAELAGRCDALTAFATGLHLVPAGAALAERLHLTTSGAALEWLRARHGASTAYSLAWAVAQPSIPAGARHLVLRLVPSPAAMRAFEPLARKGRAGLVAAYFVRLGRHGSGLPLGVYQVCRAVVQTRSAERRSSRQRPAAGLWRALLRGDLAGLGTAGWSLFAVGQVRRQLRTARLDEVEIARPPRRAGNRAGAAVPAGLRLAGATCLEHSLVRQRWHASRGDSRVLVIGVSAPAHGFTAHAWLEGDPDGNQQHLGEIARLPVPERWLPALQRRRRRDC